MGGICPADGARRPKVGRRKYAMTIMERSDLEGVENVVALEPLQQTNLGATARMRDASMKSP